MKGAIQPVHFGQDMQLLVNCKACSLPYARGKQKCVNNSHEKNTRQSPLKKKAYFILMYRLVETVTFTACFYIFIKVLKSFLT